MKIIGGKYKGKNFYMPEGIRPTQDIVRKALFDLLGRDLSGMTFLDLFAGSGSVGLEAVSRGAVEVTLVERVFRFCEIIRENLALLSAGADEGGRVPCEVMSGDAFAAVKLLSRKGQKFDIIFADPPYGRGLAKKILKTLGAYDILSANCTAVIQHDKEEILPDEEGRFLLFMRRKYGGTVLSIYHPGDRL